MPDELKPVLARQMEVYAGVPGHTDYHVGRLIDTLDDLGILDDTLVYYIIGDNGASAEGTINGTFNETFIFNGAASWRPPSSWRRRSTSSVDPRRTTTTRSVGRTRWTRRTSGPSRSRRTGAAPATARSCTGRTASPRTGELRSQFCHVIDVAPTVLDAAGLPAPTFVHGVQQMPHHGTSMTYSFDDADAVDATTSSTSRCSCNRGIYHQGWTAVTRHSTPWVIGADLPAIDDDVWELYGPDDWTQAHDIAGENPAKLAELQRLFLIEATKYNVFPLDDRRVERFNADLAGRPQLIQGTTQLLFGGMGRLSENSVLVTKNKSHAITANVTVPDGGADGVIIAQGGAFAGWSLYVNDGTPTYCYNLLGLQRFIIEGDRPFRRAITRCAWSSTTTAAGSPRAAPSASTSTATRR